MPKTHSPRHGSLQFWPRKRAKRIVPRVRSWPTINVKKLLGFPGYKVGMSHVLVIDNRKTSLTKGKEVWIPVTIIETPPIKIYAARVYKKTPVNLYVYKDIILTNDEILQRVVDLPKKDIISQKVAELNALEKELNEIADIRLLVYTQPKLTGIGKKKPEILEIAIGGSINDKYNFVKEHLNKEIKVSDVFNPGVFVDVHAVTKGKGYQGPVKRFGISLKSHKSQKGRRRPGSLGAWTPSRVDFRVPMAGQTGFHLRTELNKIILEISDNVELYQPSGGFMHYGVIRNQFVVVKGSIPGSSKRIVLLTFSKRQTNPIEVPEIVYRHK